MAEFYKLENEVKHYAWGSPDMIPALLGIDNTERKPFAELWMGIHPEAPSKTSVQGKIVPLSNITGLPFLFKFLAAGKPLSIQAHPNLAQARAGFEKENSAGIPLSAAERNYRDPNHKPEIICALGSFTAMVGFREPSETAELLSMIHGAGSLAASLREGYRPFLSKLFGLNDAEKKALNNSVLAAQNQLPNNPAEKKIPPINLCGELARFYPNDPGIISPLYLNVIKLKPFEAIFLPAGILHAYINGFAMECMANSDNVLRGGLTPKHIDLPELFSILSFDPFKPDILKPGRLVSPGSYRYETPCGEFTLYLIQNPAASGETNGRQLEAPEMGIFAVYDGSVDITLSGGKSGKKNIVLKKGESVFINRREARERLCFNGDFTLFAALAPD